MRERTRRRKIESENKLLKNAAWRQKASQEEEMGIYVGNGRKEWRICAGPNRAIRSARKRERGGN